MEHPIENDITLQELIQKAINYNKKNNIVGPVSINVIVVSPIPKFLRHYKSSALSYKPLSGDKIELRTHLLNFP